MLKITRVPSGFVYYRPGTLGVGAVNMSCLIGPFNRFTKQAIKVNPVYEMRGSLKQGSYNSFHDSEVYHSEYDGELYGFEFKPTLKTTYPDLNPTYCCDNPVWAWAELLVPGSKIEKIYPDSSGTGYYRCFWQYDGTTLVQACQFTNSSGQALNITLKVSTWIDVTTMNMKYFYTTSASSWDEVYRAISLRVTTGPSPGFEFYTPLAPKEVDFTPLLTYLHDQAGPSGFYSLIPADTEIWGDLSQACADQLGYVDINSLSFLNEAREVKKLIPKFKGWTNPKTYASVYLAFRYGLTLTAQDIEEIFQAIIRMKDATPQSGVRSIRAGKSRAGSVRGITFSEKYRSKISIGSFPDPIVDLTRSLLEWDLYPTLANDWDLIPFSFVVDWVLNVSSLLERIDTGMRWAYYSVLSVCKSRKTLITVPSDQLTARGFRGTCVLRVYSRSIENQIDLPSYRIDAPKEFHNWVDLGALLVQMSK